MKTFSDEALEVLAGREPIIAGAARFVFDQAYHFWSGFGTLQHDGAPHLGTGALALIMPHQSQLGGAAQGLSIRLSGIDPDIAQAFENENYHQKPCVISRLVFADKATMIGSSVFMRGRVDYVQQLETIGGACVLSINIEGPRRDMNRAGSRVRSDPDQRILGGSTDGGMKHITYAGRKMLYWGNKPQVASEAVSPGFRPWHFFLHGTGL